MDEIFWEEVSWVEFSCNLYQSVVILLEPLEGTDNEDSS